MSRLTRQYRLWALVQRWSHARPLSKSGVICHAAQMARSWSRSLISVTAVAVVAGGLSSCSDSTQASKASGTVAPAGQAATVPVTGSGLNRSATDETKAVVDTTRSFFLAADEHNGDAFINLMSENLCKNDFGGPCSGLRAKAANLFVDQPSIDIRSVTDPVILKNTAAIDFVGRIQGGLHHVHLGLVRTEGKWLVDELRLDASPPVALPTGVPVVDVTQTEYGFAFDASKLSSGIFALRVHNTGQLQHELVIKRVDANAVLGTETLAIPVAGIQAIDPGSTSNVVLAEQLPPGHYFIFCEVPDGEGQTHLQHGMSAEFTVSTSK